VRKLTVLVAMLAMVLAAGAPAFAQTAVDDSVAIDNSDRVVYEAGAQNVIGSIETGDAIQSGDATATATDGSVAVATIDADLDTSVEISNEFGNVFFFYYFPYHY
jgi:hypothetical protein